jgi:hypothetical protein
MTSSAFPFDKLNGDNYKHWATYMRHYLNDSKELFDYCDGSLPAPGSTVGEAAALANWKVGNGKALSRIIMNVDVNQLAHVEELKTAKEAWDMLKQMYASESTLDGRYSAEDGVSKFEVRDRD